MGVVQIIIDDTANKIITGSYTFDRDNGGTLIVPSGAAFPGTPVAGETFWRTDLNALYRRDDSNTSWVAVATYHGNLLGLGNDDHTQYQLRSEENVANGYAGLDASAKVAAAQLNLASVAPGSIAVGAGTAGASTNLARQDHNHTISTAAAVANPPGSSNTEGVATSLARSDHKHQLAAFGTGSGTFCEGNDARLSDDRTASGLRSATTVVGVSAAAAPTSGQILTATGGTAATWQNPAPVAPPTDNQAVATTNATTTSGTDVLLTGMTLTPGAGNWLVILSGSFSIGTNNRQINLSIYVNGVQVNGSQRIMFFVNNSTFQISTLVMKVTAGAGQAIEIRWSTSGGATGTASQRTLNALAVT